MAAGFGAALIFLCLLIAEIILSLVVLCYTGHCFLVVVQDTAAGNDEVTWPDEPPQDWIARGVYAIGMVVIWLIPFGVVRAALINRGVGNEVLLPLLVGAAGLLWLMLPVSLLSSMSASSRLFLLRTAVLRALMRIPGTVVTFYLISALLFAGWLALASVTLSNESWLLLPLAAAAGPVVLMIYARLLGRVAWRIAELKPIKRKKVTPVPPVPGIRVEVQDPWAAPRKGKRKNKAEAAQPKSPVEGYAVSDEPPPPQPSVPPMDGYKAIGEETFVAEPPPPPRDEHGAGLLDRPTPRPTELDLELARKSKPAAAPSWPMVSGIYSFPWRSANLKQTVFIALGLFGMGGLYILMHFPGQ
jgi:hypothetical protein